MPTKVAIIKKNYAKTARIFQALTGVVIVAAGVYGYLQYGKLSLAQAALNEAGAKVAEYQSAADASSAAYGNLKQQAESSAEDITNKIQEIFPQTENFTALTKKFDDYFTANDKPDNRIFQNSISFGLPEIKADREYAVLPFSMNIITSRENFEKFLRYVDGSGDLETGVRLMDIKSVSLTLPPEPAEGEVITTTAEPQDMTISLMMSSYFQKPLN